MKNQIEIWKNVFGYETDYEISNFGNVKSITRIVDGKVGNKTTRKGIERKLNKDIDGYYILSLSKNKKAKTIKVHRLVALTFIPNPENNPQVNHINGIKTDNHVDNLEWCTLKENRIHAFRTGLQKGPQGEKQHMSKLTKKDVLKIRKMSKDNSQQKLADLFNVSRANISAIVRRYSWKHI